MPINDRIAALRTQMKMHKLDAYMIPSNDPHQSEYVADFWKSRQWISGFTGSAGIAIVTAGHAGIWTDSRYFLQAEKELAASEFKLHKQVVPYAPEHLLWLKDNLTAGSKLGVDGSLFSVRQFQALERKLGPKGIEIIADQDLIAPIWEDRPALPQEKAFEHELGYAGESRAEKLGRIRRLMAERGAQYYLVTTLDDIAWALNIRSADVEFNPVCISYLLIGEQECVFFVAPEKITAYLGKSLKKDRVRVEPYEGLKKQLAQVSGHKILIDPASTSIDLYDRLEEADAVLGDNLIRPLKAIKNKTEIRHIREAMRKDGVALTKLYRWLEAALPKRAVTEVEVANQLDHFRRAQGEYHGESFAAIVGYNANGAIVHYRAQPESCAQLKPEGILLLDSGGQYSHGTTDITRTVALGPVTDAQKRHFTLVLKGYIALDRARFPKGTNGVQLDTLARMHLWQDSLNYGHGTGHGVGFFLNVHEPPQGFAPTAGRGSTPFQPGMLTSNEPGFYLAGQYGIRTENLILCVESGENEFGTFYAFETLTLFPIDLDLVDESLLTAEEKHWINRYHEKVFQELAPRLNPEEREWLERECRALAV
jgi:Xaa-Pro aminopeptidase